MSDDQFDKLFQYVQEMRSEMDRQFGETNQKIDAYAGAVDAFAKQTGTYMQEMLMLGNKVDRLEQWILKVAEATGVKLTT